MSVEKNINPEALLQSRLASLGERINENCENQDRIMDCFA
jgi:hypothetical protein